MKTKEWRTVDKSAWGEGPWTEECDKLQFADPATGLPCLIVRNPGLGHLCGYVGVAPGHPLYSVGYSDCPVKCEEDYCSHRPESTLTVHGGITYADFCRPGHSEAEGICHTPDPGEPDRIFWFGFDMAHCDDLSPATAALSPALRKWGTYKDLAYVKAECLALANQLAGLIERE